jgi:hypothetical protein
MSIEHMIMAALSAFSALLGWLGRELWSAVKSLRRDVEELRVHLAEQYVRRDGLRDALSPITAQLDRIEQTLLGKQDKRGGA